MTDQLRQDVADAYSYRKNKAGLVDEVLKIIANHDRELVEGILEEFPDRFHPRMINVTFIDLEPVKDRIRTKYLEKGGAE